MQQQGHPPKGWPRRLSVFRLRRVLAAAQQRDNRVILFLRDHAHVEQILELHLVQTAADFGQFRLIGAVVIRIAVGLLRRLLCVVLLAFRLLRRVLLQVASEEAYVLDIPESAATTLAQVSVNTDQVKTDRIREILITQTDSLTNLYIYYDNTDYGASVPLDFVWSDHPDALVLDGYDEETRLSCHALTLPTAEVDLSNQTVPLRDLKNNQLMTVDLQTGVAAL